MSYVTKVINTTFTQKTNFKNPFSTHFFSIPYVPGLIKSVYF